MNSTQYHRPIWACSKEQSTASNMNKFREYINVTYGLALTDYAQLHRWSIENIGEFWCRIWEFCGVIGQKGDLDFNANGSMLDAEFFPLARFNFAENLLKHAHLNDGQDALVFWGEDRVKKRVSWRELNDDVSRIAQGMRSAGVTEGDRVAAYMPNIPQTIVCMLAATSIGAIWSSCSPDFGVRGVIDRFGQIEPKLLIAADGYFYNGKEIDNLAKVEQIVTELPSLEKVVLVPYLCDGIGNKPSLGQIDKAVFYSDYLNAFQVDDIEFAQLPFDHPLYILFSSGTTGAPKCIVHGAGGTLLQHLKEHQLHNDIRSGDRVFYFTTCTWMMWNWLVSSLASGATVLLFDGSPFYPKPAILFDYADAEAMTHFGTSAKYIDALKNEELNLSESHSLQSVRVMNSTGSPLVAENFDYVYTNVKADLYLASISGGTDIISCFVLGDPSGHVYRGEIACSGLGMAIEVWDDNGNPVLQEKGELVCTKAFPSMPIYFWNDPSKEKYYSAYFDRYGDVWAQGDYAEITSNNGVVIHGRSDATLNPGGVRIGTAEIYRQVEGVGGVVEAVVIGQSWSDDIRVVLFVVMAEGKTLDDTLRSKIKSRIRSEASPRHVPAVIVQVKDIPRTKSGKISELAVRDVVEGRPIKNTSALANPEALDHYRDLEALTS